MKRFLCVAGFHIAVAGVTASADDSDRLLTIDQVAVYLGRTREAVEQLASSGRIPTVRADRRVFLDRLDLDKWIDDHKTGWV